MRIVFCIGVLLGLSACVSTPQSAGLLQRGQTSPFLQPVSLTEVPFFPQQAYQCGPAALATLLQTSQVNVSPDALVPLVYLPARRGSLQIEMLAASRTFGRIAYRLSPSLTNVLKQVQGGRPVLVMQNLGLSWYPRWHYAVVVGYDLPRREIVLHSGIKESYRQTLQVFERTWQRADHWAMVVLRPGEMPIDADELRYFDAIAALEQARPDIRVASAYRVGLQQWPASIELAMGLGNLLYRKGYKQEAAREFSTLLDQHPLYAPAHNNLAQVLLELGDSETALHHAQMAVAQGGNHLPAFKATLSAIVLSSQ
ncbi:MAG: PA2778 family cysteine peptidase [Pseudomonadales bacterium]